MGTEKNIFRFTIRAKLFFLSVAVFSIPYFGYEYLRELENYLRTSLETSLVDAARAVAGPMHENYQLFPYTESVANDALFIHKLKHPIQLDGYTDDWASYLDWSKIYSSPSVNTGNNQNEPFSFKLILGQYDHQLYAMIQVHDDQVLYQQPSSKIAIDGDNVELVIGDDYQVTQHYYFSTVAPGRFNPFQIQKYIEDWEEKEFKHYVTNISAEWQQTETGYNIEISIPLTLVNRRMGFLVADVDDINSRLLKQTVGTAGQDTNEDPGRLLQPSSEIEQTIRRLDTTEGRRIWVLDEQGHVLASSGSLLKDFTKHPLNLFYSFILPAVSKRFKDDLAGASRLQGQEILSALNGSTQSRWRQTPDKKAVIVSAAAPIWVNEEVRGVVVVEETTNNIQMSQRYALVSLFNKTFLVFMVIIILLLIFATRISMRLRRLSKQADAAIDEHGRVIHTIKASKASDEIGDLSRNYSAMLERLRQYNNYLESLASKLSHELRTPMAIVQSSLENLQLELQGNEHKYLDRAQEGIHRLNLLVSRLSEAARLEQALQSAEHEEINLCKLMENCIEGYRLAYPQIEFNLIKPDEAIYKNISPELFIQMIDKIVSNAVDFSSEDKPVEISLIANNQIIIQIKNYGSALPEKMQGQLFNSMISVRDKKTNEPHLGLGLYIAKHIAEFHCGSISATNFDGGVCFTVNFG